MSELQLPRMQPQVHRTWVDGIGMGLDFPSGSILHFTLLLAGHISIGVSRDCLKYSVGRFQLAPVGWSSWQRLAKRTLSEWYLDKVARSGVFCISFLFRPVSGYSHVCLFPDVPGYTSVRDIS